MQLNPVDWDLFRDLDFKREDFAELGDFSHSSAPAQPDRFETLRNSPDIDDSHRGTPVAL